MIHNQPGLKTGSITWASWQRVVGDEAGNSNETGLQKAWDVEEVGFSLKANKSLFDQWNDPVGR